MKYKLVRKSTAERRRQEATDTSKHSGTVISDESVVSSVLLQVGSNIEVSKIPQEEETRDVDDQDQRLSTSVESFFFFPASEEAKEDPSEAFVKQSKRSSLLQRMKSRGKSKKKVVQESTPDTTDPVSKTWLAAGAAAIAAAGVAAIASREDHGEDVRYHGETRDDASTDSPVTISEAIMSVGYLDDDDKSSIHLYEDTDDDDSTVLDFVGDVYEETDYENDYHNDDEEASSDYSSGYDATTFHTSDDDDSSGYDVTTLHTSDDEETDDDQHDDPSLQLEDSIDVGSDSDSDTDDDYVTDNEQPSLGEETEVSLVAKDTSVEHNSERQGGGSGWFSGFHVLPTHNENDASSHKGDHGSISSDDHDDHKNDDGSQYSLPLRDHDNEDDDFSQQDPQEVGYDEFRERMQKDKRKKLWRKLTLKNMREKRRQSKTLESREEEEEPEEPAWYDFGGGGGGDARANCSYDEEEHDHDGSAASRSCLKPTIGIKKFGKKIRKKFKKNKSKEKDQEQEINENASFLSGSFFGRQQQQESDIDDYLSEYSSDLASTQGSTKNNADDEEGWATFFTFFANDQSKAARLMS